MKLRAIKQANFLWHKIIGKFFSDYFAKFNRLNFTLHYRAIYLKLRAACGLFFGKFSLFTSRACCALFLASFVIGCNSSANIGDVAPEISAKTMQQTPVKLSDFANKNKILLFWSYGCAGCTKIIPALDDFLDRYGADFEVFAINSYNIDEDIFKFNREHKLRNVRVLKDDFTLTFERYEVQFLPMIVVIGRDGKIVQKIIGDMPWESIESRLLSLL